MVYQDQLCHLSLKELQTKALALVSRHGKNTHILSDVLNKLIMHFSMAPARRGLERVSHPFSCSTQKASYILSAGTAERVGCDGKEVMKAKSVPACQPHPVPGLHVCTCVCVRVSLFMYTCAKSGPRHGPGNITQPQQVEQEKSQAGAWCSCAKLAAKMEIPWKMQGKGTE